MKVNEIVLYEVDGVRFNYRSEAERYSAMCTQINGIMEGLSPRTEAVDQGLECIEHHKASAELARRLFLELCAKSIPAFAEWFSQVAEGSRHESHIDRILGDYEREFPILWKTWFRFKCINRALGLEFQQPYFANRPEEALEDIKKRREYYRLP